MCKPSSQRHCAYSYSGAETADSYARWRSTRFAILLLSLRFFFSFRFFNILHYATEHVNVNKWNCLTFNKKRNKTYILNFDANRDFVSYFQFLWVNLRKNSVAHRLNHQNGICTDVDCWSSPHAFECSASFESSWMLIEMLEKKNRNVIRWSERKNL